MQLTASWPLKLPRWLVLPFRPRIVLGMSLSLSTVVLVSKLQVENRELVRQHERDNSLITQLEHDKRELIKSRDLAESETLAHTAQLGQKDGEIATLAAQIEQLKRQQLSIRQMPERTENLQSRRVVETSKPMPPRIVPATAYAPPSVRIASRPRWAKVDDHAGVLEGTAELLGKVVLRPLDKLGEQVLYPDQD